ncbi:hypothetical protein CFV354_0959 [Campylobacter fetus subsp. venerealis NCTC 10354]|nr:hypothetical protein CFV354_0959 [Campylobacter fetus subsp. venerealis NCTC 10354]
MMQIQADLVTKSAFCIICALPYFAIIFVNTLKN